MAAGLNARAVSHLEEVSEQGIKDMAAAGELQPCLSFILPIIKF